MSGKAKNVKLCVACSAHIFVACKKCPTCKSNQPHKQRLVGERSSFDGGAYKARVKKNCNSSHVIDSSLKMLDRLAALGYFPLLLVGKRHKGSYTAQVLSSIQMQLDASLVEDLQAVYAKVLKLHFKRLKTTANGGSNHSAPQPQVSSSLESSTSSQEHLNFSASSSSSNKAGNQKTGPDRWKTPNAPHSAVAPHPAGTPLRSDLPPPPPPPYETYDPQAELPLPPPPAAVSPLSAQQVADRKKREELQSWYVKEKARLEEERERKLGQIRANPVMPVQPHNNGGSMPPPQHHQQQPQQQPRLPSFTPPQPYVPPQTQPPVPSRPEKLASLPRTAVPPPANSVHPPGTQSRDEAGMERQEELVIDEGADEYVVLNLIPYEEVAGQDDQGTQSRDEAGMERQEELVIDEGAGNQSSDGVGMEREQEGRMETKDENIGKIKRKRKHQTATQSSDGVNKNENTGKSKRKTKHQKDERCDECAERAASGKYLFSKIVRRTTDQVLLQWLPCKKCGIKWKNTWEPINFLDQPRVIN